MGLHLECTHEGAAQNSICVPNSTTRLGGMQKNSVAERAFRAMIPKMILRHRDSVTVSPGRLGTGMRRSRPRT